MHGDLRPVLRRGIKVFGLDTADDAVLHVRCWARNRHAGLVAGCQFVGVRRISGKSVAMSESGPATDVHIVSLDWQSRLLALIVVR